MTQVAVPQRVADIAEEFRDAAPGHRFNLYFPIWTQSWSADPKGKTSALERTTRIPSNVRDLVKRLRERQRALATPEAHLSVPAKSESPFATGLGNEHPVENGFAFLTPYGLPYLAGSGVKGVLRRAAEELALYPEDYRSGDAAVAQDFTLLDVWWLFGFEGASGAWWPLTTKEEKQLTPEQKEGHARWEARFKTHCQGLTDRPDLSDFIKRALPNPKEAARYLDESTKFLANLDSLRSSIHTLGALNVWDVFPDPKGGRLAVEIMTPHYTDYYQGKGTPHDAGQPNPIPFLVVPAGSDFEFHVICQVERLPQPIRDRWEQLVSAVFEHAFEWLGFGAKTAVGYGQMVEDVAAREERLAEQQRVREEAERERRLAQLSPMERSIAEALAEKVDRGLSEGVYLVQLLEAGRWQGDEGRAVAAIVRDRLKDEKKWKEATKKPDKDKDYKRTQTILKILSGK
ncbi:type III-B CRISPR module RAMP protein Cmr6 [Thiorhodococcus minor]|uniref:Type III-B CRISPR module RAMP protein Cmr6 n=1 Tax=Thiorhodococcus minor TaxID=57489 RepID=A0A6M0K7S4_9GAMM|nr:type III-B CRISPR module RAMP protein Cmr6 [Thiorhodococcus minor]NEV64435.1 type III-B CRISPR module RAMP protein Cmr6 [Thiorhodococcus minor]